MGSPMRTGIRIVIALLLAAPAYADSGGHWGYAGDTGPAHWGALSEDYHACGEGAAQSPVNIRRAVHSKAQPPATRYGPIPLRVVNNGHTVQVNYGKGASMQVDGKTYQLLQFHFHSPSEHQLDGGPFAMEAHLVHRADDGTLAVIGVLMREGEANPVVERIWAHVSDEVGHEVTVPGQTVDASDLLPPRSGVWHYPGSLTTPPCTEGVWWLVMKNIQTASQEQIRKFTHAMHHPNNRPVQPVNARLVVK